MRLTANLLHLNEKKNCVWLQTICVSIYFHWCIPFVLFMEIPHLQTCKWDLLWGEEHKLYIDWIRKCVLNKTSLRGESRIWSWFKLKSKVFWCTILKKKKKTNEIKTKRNKLKIFLRPNKVNLRPLHSPLFLRHVYNQS